MSDNPPAAKSVDLDVAEVLPGRPLEVHLHFHGEGHYRIHVESDGVAELLLRGLHNLRRIETMTQELLDAVAGLQTGQANEDATISNLANVVSTVSGVINTDFAALTAQVADLQAKVAAGDPDVPNAVASLQTAIANAATNVSRVDAATTALATALSTPPAGP